MISMAIKKHAWKTTHDSWINSLTRYCLVSRARLNSNMTYMHLYVNCITTRYQSYINNTYQFDIMTDTISIDDSLLI